MAIVDINRGVLNDQGSPVVPVTTGNDYVDAAVWPAGFLKSKSFSFTCITNDLKVKVLGSLDGGVSYPFTEVAEFTVTAAAAATRKDVSAYYTHLKVQVKPAVNDVHGTLGVSYAGVSF